MAITNDISAGSLIQGGSSLAGGIIGGIVGAVEGKKNRKHQLEMQANQIKANAEAQQRQYQLNELAAGNSDKRARALFRDFESPEARRKQLEEAGLSVGLMYSGAGAGTAGHVGQGAQGSTGLAGASGASGNPYNLAGGIQAGAQAALAMSQARLNNAEAKDVEENTSLKKDTHETNVQTASAALDNLRANLNEIVASTGLKNAQKNLAGLQGLLTQAQTEAQEAENEFSSQSWDIRMATLGQSLANLEEEWRELNTRNNFTEDTYEDGVRAIKLENNKLIEEILKAQCEREGIKADTARLWQDAKLSLYKMKTEHWRSKNEEDLFKRFSLEMEHESEIARKERRNQVFKEILHGIFSAAVSITFMRGAGMRNATPKPVLSKKTIYQSPKRQGGMTREEYYDYR